MQPILRAVSPATGIFVIMTSIALGYGAIVRWLHVITAAHLGPRAAVNRVAAFQCASYALMGMFCYRYLARLYPITLSFGNDRAAPRLSYDGLASTAPFWIGLLAALVTANQAHGPQLSLPALIFNVVLLALLAACLWGSRLSWLSGDVPLVLFLRPFSSSADRSLLSGILNRPSVCVQVVFLVPQWESHRNWDPFSLGMAGFHFIRLFRSCPVPVVCSDCEWGDAVRHLISRSRLVVIDVTTTTPSLEAEISLLHESQALGTTMAFFDESIATLPEAGIRRQASYGWLMAIGYRRTLNPFRIVISFLITAAAVFVVGHSIGLYKGPLGQLKAASILLTLAIGAYCLYYWFVLFCARSQSGEENSGRSWLACAREHWGRGAPHRRVPWRLALEALPRRS